MTVNGAVVPGLLFLLAELVALAGVGYVVVRVALRETDDRIALAQGLVVGPAIWGVVVNLVMYAIPGMAGAVAGWIFVLALAAVLTWRAPQSIRPRLRAAAGFALAALALFWAALASRQMMGIIDPYVHIGLAASIREGLFPPQLPHNPGLPAPYHYGFYLLNGLLSPPFGPNLAFTEELLGAYVWLSLVLIVATALLRRASRFAMLIIIPLLLTPGGWTLMFNEPFSILEAPLPAGIPSAGLRTSLMDTYWPLLGLPLDSQHAMPPNIWTPSFALSYAVGFIVLTHAARARRRSWLSVMTLAALIGFLGLTAIALVPIVFVLWAGLEAVWLIQSRRAGSVRRSDMIQSASGLALAAMLLLAGGFSTLILDDSVTSGLSLGGNEHLGRWRLLGSLDRLSGGVGILGLGPLAVAGIAVLLARRDRLVQALAAGSGLLLLAALPLRYEPLPRDLVRFEGHARNFALLALLIALGVRLAGLRPARWRYVAGAAVVALIVWPTAVAPVRNVGLAIGHGVELANAQPRQQPTSFFGGRFRLRHLPVDRIAAYVRNHTAADARVFSPHPGSMTFATGRPNASGFAGLVHLFPTKGPEYQDVLDYLEPAAVRLLGFEYVHAPDAWVESLPDEAADRLNDPRLFELLVRDESESLYRVLPAFLSLDAVPASTSYEALRQAVSASATVFLLRPEKFDTRPLTRTAWALSHAGLFAVIDSEALHLRTPWHTEPLDDNTPDLVVMPLDFVPWMFPPASRQPIWRNDANAVYTLDGTVDPITPPPLWAEPLPFGVRVSDVLAVDARITFTATFDDRAPDQWTSQDWVLIATQAPPWDLPKQVLPNGAPSVAMWFVSYLNPGKGASSFPYEFDFLAPSLAVRRENGVLKPLDRSEAVLDSGSYVLAVRLRHEYKPNQWRAVAYIPVLRITVSQTGEVSYQVHEAAGGEPAQ